MEIDNKNYYINILTPNREARYLRQLDPRFEQQGFFFFENSEEDRIWDYVVVHDDVSTLQEIKVRAGGLVLLAGEPEFIRYYGRGFLRQFDWAITTHQRLKHRRNHFLQNIALNWHFGYKHSEKQHVYSYTDLGKMPIPEKTKNVSVITSSLELLPGHVKRMELLKKLRKRYGDKIDFFGKGICFIDDKAEALLPYRFHIALENSSDPHYWSEKLADPLLGFCVPVYCGDPCAEDYFGSQTFMRINVENEKEVFDKLDLILADPVKAYHQFLPHVISARNKILEKYNFFPMFVSMIPKFERGDIRSNNGLRKIAPNASFLGSRIGMAIIRTRRLLFRLQRKVFK